METKFLSGRSNFFKKELHSCQWKRVFRLVEAIVLQLVLNPSGRNCLSVYPKPFVRKTFLFQEIEMVFRTSGNHLFIENMFSRLWKQYFVLVESNFVFFLNFIPDS